MTLLNESNYKCPKPLLNKDDKAMSYGFFDRNADGSLHQKAFAGQTADRTVHKGDLTGIEIISRLMEQIFSRPIEKLQEHRAIAFIPTKDKSALAGVLFIDMRSGNFRFVRAKTVLMATGGGPTMYKYHTPSGDKTMDGLSMAMRLGLEVRDMEMVQFHPTGLLAGEHTRMTIAYLNITIDNHRFTDKAHCTHADRVPKFFEIVF